MKVVINSCFGGFSLSPLAIKALAKRKGRKCFVFKDGPGTGGRPYTPVSDTSKGIFLTAFDVPNPNDFDEDELWAKHHLTSRPEDRTDADLIAVIEELGKAANGSCASLSVVEIPDDVQWEISEYDGNEHIAEVHRTWS